MVSAIRYRLLLPALLLAGLPLLPGCVPLPLRSAPGVAGVVVDSDSGEPLAGAVVVVAFEGSYDEVLPERERLGHREAVTDANGRFETPPLFARGMTAWPWLRIRTRVVAAWAADHRCASNVLPPRDGPVHVALTPAADADDQRETCRSVPAALEDAPRYTRLWRALHGGNSRLAERPAPNPALDRSLAARATLGFGANCQGPVLDVSLDPTGARAGLLVREGERLAVELVELDRGQDRGEALMHASPRPERRLAWSPDGELFLLAAAARLDAPVPGSDTAALEATRQRVWVPEALSLPAAPAPFVDLDAAESRHDDASNRYGGRSFETLQSLDPETGLPEDQLRVTEPDGQVREIALPGEACREGGRFGRPHYRLTRDGRTGLDLRFVDGRCHAVAIDLVTGDWRALEAPGSEPAVCATSRRLPRLQLDLALRGYLRELEDRLSESGLDPFAAFTLLLDPEGRATIRTVDAAGVGRRIPAPPFPITTPLSQIEISVVAPPPAGMLPRVEAGPAEEWKPL